MPHEPPIGGGGGSFFFDLPDGTINLDAPTLSGGYQTYNLIDSSNTRKDYSAIAKIAILTENHDADFSVHNAAENENVKLKLWLSETKDSPGNAEPDVIIDGANGGSISTNILLEPAIKTNKKVRNSRLYYPNRAMSVVKWHLEGNTYDESGEGDDMYYFYISFHHPH